MSFSNQIKLAYHALKTKLHIDEIAAGTVEVIQHTHRHVMHTIEAIASRIPPLMLLVESIGHIAAITQLRHDHHPNKKALGFKVTTGFMMLAVGIIALALPHISIPLIIAGLTCGLSYQFFSIHHIHHKIRQLQTTLKSLPQHNTQQHDTINQQLDKLMLIYREQRQQRTEKVIRSIVSVVVLVAMIAVFANPITAIPATITALCISTGYLAYHLCKPLLLHAHKHNTAKLDHEQAASHLKTETEPLENEVIIEAKQEQQTQKEAQVTQFLDHEDAALAKILQPKPELISPQKSATKRKNEAAEEDEDEDGDAGERDTTTETKETVELI